MWRLVNIRGSTSRKTCLLQSKFFDTFWWSHTEHCIHQLQVTLICEPVIRARATHASTKIPQDQAVRRQLIFSC